MFMIREDVVRAVICHLTDIEQGFRDKRPPTANQAGAAIITRQALIDCIEGKFDAKLET